MAIETDIKNEKQNIYYQPQEVSKHDSRTPK